MNIDEPRTNYLSGRVLDKDQSTYRELLERYRQKLTRVISFRIDPRVSARVDPADIVQETLIEAHQRLPTFLERDGYSFYVWVRAIAISRLQDVHRKHIGALRRSVEREEMMPPILPDESVWQLADRIAGSAITPSAEVRKCETIAQLKHALGQLEDGEREVLILKYLEELATPEIAAIQEVTERTVRRRHRQAIEKLGRLLRSVGLDFSS